MSAINQVNGVYASSAGRGISATSPGYSATSDVTEVITLFPGWAAKRYDNQAPAETLEPNAPRPFQVEVFASGYAISYRNRDNMSRSHRAFIRLAKGFASLPKLVSEAASATPTPPSSNSSSPPINDPRLSMSRSTEELLANAHLPPRPEEMDAAYNIAYLEENGELPAPDRGALNTADLTLRQPPPDPALMPARSETPMRQETSAGEAIANLTSEAITKLHANLEARLKPFWSSVVVGRTVRLHLFASPRNNPTAPSGISEDDASHEYNIPLDTVEVTTDNDGSFQARFVVDWDKLCCHPRGLHIAFGHGHDSGLEHEVVVVAELLEPPSPEQRGPPVTYTTYSSSRSPTKAKPTVTSTDSTGASTRKTNIHIPITHSPIRVISDIDDTVKKSEVLGGARSVFYNVFAKELEECVVPGMGEWYTKMWKNGVRFHYVSNGPFEYTSVLNEFFPLAQLPPGSFKLKSYARRSLFNGLMTTAAGRKRAGVEEVLDSFPDSRFFLIGDSGEQDLELYADLTRQRPNNILGVFIRDVSTIEGVTDPIDDPTGGLALIARATRSTVGLSSESQANLASETDSTFSNDRDAGIYGQGQRRPSVARSVSSLLASAVGKRSGSISSLWSRDSTPNNVQAQGQDGYFDSDSVWETRKLSDALHEEPEDMATPQIAQSTSSGQGQVGDANPTPRMNSTPTMTPSSTIKQSSSAGQFITEPPKATPPPSLHGRRRRGSTKSSRSLANSENGGVGVALADIATRRSQRTGDAASSISTSSSSSSRFSYDGSDPNDPSAGHAFKARFERVTRQMNTAVTVEDRRRAELQLRVWQARTVMPDWVVLRVFRHPEECVEAQEILDRELEN
ncbi:hypothetical protein CC1G_12228 [Coprinopsis cinerea okayama7|uniref:Phosphatidate phosphatase APP1 catalytic domain-containing protein n=1 Tax=Coprinopsis cinerea (strain Okayama-7 / 130 / ATCC MYA-4618 / FGSC 9003) TaxID=240176 RepID=A8NA52_COPC7|nr:hypothetical protein CC1G_12228 [Coprinopsis cinerea okayama7\|eukprot:XP_001831708.2 hypothetical protein CC1G_12228 [Coprinopsis cinerea okayama7\